MIPILTKNDYEFQFKTGQGLPFALRNEEKTEAQENVAWSSSDTSEASKKNGFFRNSSMG